MEYTITAWSEGEWLELATYETKEIALAEKEIVEVEEDTQVIIRVYEVEVENEEAPCVKMQARKVNKTLVEVI